MGLKPSTNNFKFWPNIKEEKKFSFLVLVQHLSKSPTQMGSLCVKNKTSKFSHLGTF